MEQFGIVPIHLPSGLILDAAKIALVEPHIWNEWSSVSAKRINGAIVRFVGGGLHIRIDAADLAVLRQRFA